MLWSPGPRAVGSFFNPPIMVSFALKPQIPTSSDDPNLILSDVKIPCHVALLWWKEMRAALPQLMHINTCGCFRSFSGTRGSLWSWPHPFWLVWSLIQSQATCLMYVTVLNTWIEIKNDIVSKFQIFDSCSCPRTTMFFSWWEWV